MLVCLALHLLFWLFGVLELILFHQVIIWFIAVAGIFIATHVYIMNYNKDWYYEVNIKNNGFLYSQAIILFVLEFISYINSKEAFLSTPSTMEVFKWIITLALFLSIIRVIRPLSRNEWRPKNKS